MSERRYTDDEIATIFANAAEIAEAKRKNLGASLTLPELQEIAREVGVPAEAVAAAAAQLDTQPVRGGAAARVVRRSLGLPLAVAGTVELPRKLTEEEWEQLVGDLRMTFNAAGRVSTHGSLKQWRNGNLHALVEPSASGTRVTIRTLKGSARQGIAGGITSLVGAAAMFVLAAAEISKDPDVLRGSLVLGLVGAGMIALSALQLPAWARRRLQQIESVLGRVLAQRT